MIKHRSIKSYYSTFFNICVTRRICNLSNSMQIVYRILFDFVILNSFDYDYWLFANTLIRITIVDSSECWLNLFDRFIYWIPKAFDSFHFFTLALRRVLKCILQDVNYELSYIIRSLFQIIMKKVWESKILSEQLFLFSHCLIFSAMMRMIYIINLSWQNQTLVPLKKDVSDVN